MSNHDPAYEDTDQAPSAPSSGGPSHGGPSGRGAAHGGGGALVPQGPMTPATVAVATASPRVDVIRGGLDGASLFHSFRRRWLMALGLGLLVGAGSAVALYFLFPESSSAVALFRVASKQGEVIKDMGDDSNFDIYRRTQAVAVKSSFVLNAALKSPLLEGNKLINEIPIPDRVAWLTEELRVNFPQDSEYMEISLTGSAQPDQLESVVEAVAQAYNDEVVFAEKTSRLKPIDILRNSERKLREEVKRKADAFYALLKENNSTEVYSGPDPDTSLLIGEARDLVKMKSDSEAALQQLELNYQLQRAYLNDPAVLEQRINEAIASDPMLTDMKNDLMMMEMQMGSLQGQRNGRAAQQQQASLQSYRQQVAEYEQRLRQSLANQAEDEPDVAITTLTREYQMTRSMLQQKLEAAQGQLDETIETLRAKGEINTDIEMRRAELEQLQTMQRSIAQRIDEWNIEMEAPDRISRIPGVEKTQNINRAQRYAITGVGGLAAFALTCFGIAYLEFRNRRLNGPEQVDEGLGIRVIGTLPSLAGRKQLDPRHPVVAQLTESIDSVRTALMHESTTKRRQVVLVTSAAAVEGRTTVASQLAASLARAGRRTLLVDGDLRRPSLHALFDVPLEDGLCEVLRAESDVSDVVRPTHAEGLWLMTAGYCDADAVHALATDQAQPIFDKLRSDYDFIIIDGAPVLGLADSLLFGQHCDGAILSVLRDHTNVPKIHQSAELLRSVGIRLVGAVVNGVPIKADRRVTHLQAAGSKNARKQLENAEA